MLVYRIEDQEGGGLYRGDNSGSNPLRYDEDRHPVPQNDSLLTYNGQEKMLRDDVPEFYTFSGWFENEGFIFGFANTDQLRSWIYNDEWLVKMERRGFRLAVFDIENEHVIVGNTQAIFKRDRAKDVAFFGPAAYFDIDINEYDDEE